MNPFEFVLGIILITSVVSIIKMRYAPRQRRDYTDQDPAERDETLRLRDEVKQLKDRIHVLERIAVDKEDTLSRQIDQLRER